MRPSDLICEISDSSETEMGKFQRTIRLYGSSPCCPNHYAFLNQCLYQTGFLPPVMPLMNMNNFAPCVPSNQPMPYSMF